MKKAAIIIALLFVAMLAMGALFWNADSVVHIDGDEYGGPLGFMIASLVAGGGSILAFIIVAFVMSVLAVVFAGVGVLLLAALALGGILAVLAISPLLLPLAIPALLIWYLVKRSHNNAPAKPIAA